MPILLLAGACVRDGLPVLPLPAVPDVRDDLYAAPTAVPARSSPELVDVDVDQDGLFVLATLYASEDGAAEARFGDSTAAVEFTDGVSQVLVPIPDPCDAVPGGLDWSVGLNGSIALDVHLDLVGTAVVTTDQDADAGLVPSQGDGPLVVCGSFVDPTDTDDASITIPDGGPAGMSGGIYRFRATPEVRFFTVENVPGGYTVPGAVAPLIAGEHEVTILADDAGDYAWSVEAQ